MNKKIRIEQLSDINFDYPYLEVFYEGLTQPFIDIGITDDKQLNFKFYACSTEMDLSIEAFDYIRITAKKFLSQALKDEQDFLNGINNDITDK
ncbi:MAG: hypothetical protein RLZZ628_3638 [Bacteroidota bacterium]|jgi:hypothetical protein